MHGTLDKTQLAEQLDAILIEQVETLWELEGQLEAKMVSMGVENYDRAAGKAHEKGQPARLRPYRKLVEAIVPALARGITEWKAEQKAKRGVRSVAYQYLKDMPEGTIALVTLIAALNRVAAPKPPLVLSVGLEIGSRLEDEARMIAWQKANPGFWNFVQRDLTENHADVLHRRRVNVNRFNAVVRPTIEWSDWPLLDRKQIGLAMLNCLKLYTGGRFDVVLGEHKEASRKKRKNPYVLTADPEMVGKLNEALDNEGYKFPVYMPTVIKPRPWTNMKDGGYHSEMLNGRRSLIRFKADQEEQQRMASRELSAIDMPEVYDAVNTIQEVPWKINRRVYDVARTIWDNDLGLAGIPRRALPPKPPRKAICDTDPEADAAWRRKASKWHGMVKTLPAKINKARRSLDIAALYLDYTFYFPHTIDFRGRMYPMPVDLQPQGTDFARGLLTFAEGKPLGNTGVWWLAIQVANVWGHDKVSYDDRVSWVLRNEELFRGIATDPLAHREWMAAGIDNWQALAATFEWVRYLDEGEEMISSLPVRIDGTCNGIQHLSAMVRDEDGGASVNMIPSERPRDIYLEVAAMCEAMLREFIEEGGPKRALAAYWLEVCKGKLPRSLTKRPVMILPYGGTKEAYRKYTIEWIEENHPTKFGEPRSKERNAYVAFMVDVMWEQVGKRLKKARQVQRWLQQCAQLAASTGLPLRWQTPSGFVCRHFYGQRKMFQIKTKIDGQTLQIVDWRTTAELDVGEQLQGIPPNFTHSMDASVLTTSVNKAWRAGVDMLTCIHDAYGTVAADMYVLAASLREAFVWTYQHPVLLNYLKSCIELLDDDTITAAGMPAIPDFGTLNIEDLLRSEYFFA